MASMQVHYFSYTFRSNILVHVFIPDLDNHENPSTSDLTKLYRHEKKFPAVYLLHGAYGDFNSWIHSSNIERWAQESGCALVTASAENSFYQNMYRGKAWETFFAEELPAFASGLFPISDKREDSFTLGFSMGGYGAWFLALAHPDRFSKAASMSGALDIASLFRGIQQDTYAGPFPWKDIFEDPDHLEGSHADLFALFQKCRDAGNAPKLFQTCGTEDFLYRMNTNVRDRMTALGADLTYEESPGSHNWDFWDAQSRRILPWLLDK